jgi:hypothetical protein
MCDLFFFNSVIIYNILLANDQCFTCLLLRFLLHVTAMAIAVGNDGTNRKGRQLSPPDSKLRLLALIRLMLSFPSLLTFWVNSFRLVYHGNKFLLLKIIGIRR